MQCRLSLAHSRQRRRPSSRPSLHSVFGSELCDFTRLLAKPCAELPRRLARVIGADERKMPGWPAQHVGERRDQPALGQKRPKQRRRQQRHTHACQRRIGIQLVRGVIDRQKAQTLRGRALSLLKPLLPIRVWQKREVSQRLRRGKG